ncbi:hypothetical protein F4861DRAFT_538283 [Xylaria intraflava]|nr:hypothetical protein F4861DRAFT_538283 [Xylaria intraflava]
MAAPTTSNMANGSQPDVDTTHPKYLVPEKLLWRPMPTRLEENTSSLRPVAMKPDGPVPCRRCLRDTKVGDEVLLVSYDPFLGDSPYRCATPVFIHSKPACEPALPTTSGGVFPEQQRERLLSIRAFDGNHMMKDNAVVMGDRLQETCERLLGDGSLVEYCHVHFAAPGCFAVRVERASGAN